jgi:hypothetical protein
MLMRRPPGAGRGSGGRGYGLLDAPWWRLLLWAAIVVAVLVLAIELRILG